jgi:hypothetical protein
MSKNSKRCWQKSCQNKGIKCLIPGALIDDEDKKMRYCSEHAAENGFCYSCGIFCAGIESFDFGRYRGLCDNCADEVRASDSWDDYEQEMDFEYLVYP